MNKFINLYICDANFNYDELILNFITFKNIYDYSENLILSPTKRRSKELEKKFIIHKIPNNQAIIPPKFSTFPDYLSELSSNKIISDIEVKYLFIQSLLKNKKEFYEINSPELSEEIIEFYHDLIHYFPSSEISETMNTLSNKLQEAFKKLYISEYTKKRTENILKIIDDYFNSTIRKNIYDKELIQKNFSLLKEINKLILDSLFLFRPIDLEIIKHFVAVSKESHIFFIKTEENQHLLEKLNNSLNQNNNCVNIKELKEQKKSAVFIVAKKEKEEIISSLENKEKEIRFIARKIKELALRGIPIDHIAVILPDPYLYISSIKRIFKNYKIDYNYSFGERILNEPPIQAAFSILKLIEEDFPRDILLFLLTSKYFDIPNKKLLINQIYKSEIIYGAELWRRESSELAYFIEQIDIFKNHNNLKQYFYSLIKVLSNLKFGKILGLNKREKQVIEDFFEMLYSFLNITDEKIVDFPLFKRIIRYLLTQKRYFGREKMPKGVSILGIIESLGIQKEFIFLAGLIDGSEPKIRETFILPNEIYEAFGLSTSEELIKEQKAHFYRVLNSAKEAIFLSYPQWEGDRKNIPSLFLKEYVQHNHYELIMPNYEEISFSSEEHQVNMGESQNIHLLDFYQWQELNPSSINFIKELFPPEKEINITDLLNYYDCPLIFFYKNILNLKEIEEPSYDFDAKKWGLKAHEILHESFQADDWQIEALKILPEKMKIFPEQVIEFYLKKFMLELTFLKNFQREIEKDYKIFKLEYPIAGRIEEQDFFQNIKGKIDRIDIKRDNSAVAIIDYKMGDIGNKKYELQLSLYAYLIEKNLSLLPDKLILIALAGYKSRIKNLINKRKKIDQLLKESVEEIKAIIIKIRQGYFNASEAKLDCHKCSFSYLC